MRRCRIPCVYVSGGKPQHTLLFATLTLSLPPLSVPLALLSQRFGFEIVDELKGYYKRIDPPDCYILEKKVVMKEAKETEAEAGKEGKEGKDGGEGAAAAVGGDADKTE